MYVILVLKCLFFFLPWPAAQLVGALSYISKGPGFDPCSGLRWEAINQCFTLSKKINKRMFRCGLKQKSFSLWKDMDRTQETTELASLHEPVPSAFLLFLGKALETGYKRIQGALALGEGTPVHPRVGPYWISEPAQDTVGNKGYTCKLP